MFRIAIAPALASFLLPIAAAPEDSLQGATAPRSVTVVLLDNLIPLSQIN